MTRREFSKRAKEQIRAKAGHKCEACCVALGRDKGQIDHRIPCGYFNRGELPDWIASAKNGQLLCAPCHAAKTNKIFGDKSEIAKRRRQTKRAGKRKERFGRSIQSRGWDKRFKKKFNGEVEKR